MEILNIADFTDGGAIRESSFFRRLDDADWDRFRDRPVLVRGCETTLVPPWAFMAIAARLAGVAKWVRYGNEHSSVMVCRRKNNSD